MRIKVDFDDLVKKLDGSERQIAGFLTAAMRDTTDFLKVELRDQTTGAGFSQRLANTWRGNTYPGTSISLSPSTYVWSNASRIIWAYQNGATIAPTGGRRYLWIPTDAVPFSRKPLRYGGDVKPRKRHKATPQEVEAIFGQRLNVRRTKAGKLMAFIDAVKSKNGKGYRRASKVRLAQGRSSDSIPMFVLQLTVRVPKRLDIYAAAQLAQAQYPTLLANHWR